MPRTLTQDDLDALGRVAERIIDAKLEKRLLPTEKRTARLSGAYRELAPKVEGARESTHDIEDWKEGFEPHVLGRLTRLEEIAGGTERAAVAGANAAIEGKKEVSLVSGKQAALQIAADRADASSGAANSKLTKTLIIQIVTLAVAITQIIERLLHAGP